MTSEHEHWHGLIALEVVGQLDNAEEVALDAHIEQCDSCRDERRTMTSLAQAIEGADPEHVEPGGVPLSVEQSVLRFLRDAERRTVVSNRRRYVLAGTAAAACMALLGLGLSFALSSAGKSISLSGNGAASASVTLSAESWGTSVRLTETDPHATTTLTVWMRTKSGSWWEAGTYRTSTGRSVNVPMACAVPTSEITGLWIRNPNGETVLKGYVS